MRYFRITLCLVIFLFLISATAAQAVEWVRIYAVGISGSSVQQTTDGGYVVAGRTHPTRNGGYDVCLLKTDSLGNKLWSKQFGGPAADCGYSVQQTTDGGYIIAGYTASYGAGNTDVCLIKTDSLGNKLWSKTFGGSDYDLGYSVQQTTDGGYIIAGSTRSGGNSDVWLIKTDSLGNMLWEKTFDRSGDDDEGYSVQQTTDGGYIIAGYTHYYLFDYPDTDVWLIKTDSLGNMIWEKPIAGGDWDFGYSVQQTTDGGYIIAGSTSYWFFDSMFDSVWLIKTDSLGNVLWDSMLAKGEYDEGRSVQQTADGGYIIAGSTSSGENCDAWLIKTDSSGNMLWDEVFGAANQDEAAASVQQTTDGGYIATGAGGLNLGLGKTFGP